MEMFHIRRRTHLENDDGDNRRFFVAVEFDVAAAVQSVFSMINIPTSEGDISQAVKDGTFDGYGGPVLRRTMTSCKQLLRSLCRPLSSALARRLSYRC